MSSFIRCDTADGIATVTIDRPQQHNAIEMLALTLQKFPLDRDAPELQNRVADLYDEMAEQAPAGSPLREEATAHALAARTELARYVGDTDWVRANKDDPEALQTAEKLVRQGLQQAAADHTNTARALVARAEQVKDPNEARILTEKALAEYRSAAKGWRAVIEQDPNAIEAYESRFWLADARYWIVVLQVPLDVGELHHHRLLHPREAGGPLDVVVERDALPREGERLLHLGVGHRPHAVAIEPPFVHVLRRLDDRHAGCGLPVSRLREREDRIKWRADHQ